MASWFVLSCGSVDADADADVDFDFDVDVEAEAEMPTAASEAALEATPPAVISSFGQSVRAASKQAQLEGSRSCGAPVTPVRVASQAELKAAALSYVSQSVGIDPSKIKVSAQPCGPGLGRCADLFQNDLFHNDARMGRALYPLAQRVDRETSLVDLAIYSPTGVPIVVATVGIRQGWLMGLAYFERRQSC